MKCIKCGAEGKKMIGPFCVDCYPYNITIKNIQIPKCTRCGRVRISGGWVELRWNSPNVQKFMVRHVKGTFDSVEYDWKQKAFVFKISDYGASVEVVRKVDVSFKNTICTNCMRKAGGYYEAVIQIRMRSRKMEKAERILLKCIEKNGSYVSKIDMGKQGVDMRIGNSKIAMQCIEKLGDEIKITTKKSRTLIGVSEGKRLYRITYAVKERT